MNDTDDMRKRIGRMRRIWSPLLLSTMLCATAAIPVRAQHEEHDHPVHESAEDDLSQDLPEEEQGSKGEHGEHEAGRAANTPHSEPATTRTEHSAPHAQTEADLPHREHAAMRMPSMLQPGDPMSRDGSGTSWMPDESQLHGLHQRAGRWQLMLHGTAWFRYNTQDAFNSGSRGERQFDVPTWFMGMAHRRLSSSSQIGFRGMISLDPAIVGGRGYPLLFQTGETFEGEPLIDRQHPHDLFAELAVLFGHDFGDDWGLFGYLGYPGEPALGPPVYLHRPSAAHLPDAPLGHHWQDATHIIFGTATLGVRYRILKLDGSVFTGREPNEERFWFDRPRFDSYSLRLAANPNNRLALQVSRAFLKEPEVLHPGQNQWRTSASAIYVAPAPVGSGTWATTAIWGVNERVETEAHDEREEKPPLLHSLLLESDFRIGRQAFYGRGEIVQKPAEELGLDDFDHDRTFDIRALSLGMSREIFDLGDLRFDLGGHATLYSVTSALRTIYGERPVSLQVYLRVSPSLAERAH